MTSDLLNEVLKEFDGASIILRDEGYPSTHRRMQELLKRWRFSETLEKKEAHPDSAIVLQKARAVEGLVADLREIENHCPCGARPESLNTHPHVTDCPVERALRRSVQAVADHEGLLQCRALLNVQDGDNLYDAIKRLLSEGGGSSEAEGVSPSMFKTPWRHLSDGLHWLHPNDFEKWNQRAAVAQGQFRTGGMCDTTNTVRAEITDCTCLTYAENLGPCLKWDEAAINSNGRCVYCDHNKQCHDKVAQRAAVTVSQEEELHEIRSAVMNTGITENEGSTLGMVTSICDYAVAAMKALNQRAVTVSETQEKT